jgi:GrxC family glutaredoxin
MPLGEFVIANWPLFLALVVILLLLARTWLGPGAVKGVGPAEAIQLMNHQHAVLVDVRTDKEFQQGHVMNSLHIPLGVLANRLDELQPYKDSPLVLVCRSGARSAQAAGQLKKQGFEPVYNLSGGMLAWENANLPVTTKAGRPPLPGKTAVGEVEVDEEHPVLVYTTRKCPFCTRAIDLLDAKGVGFTEVRIDTQPERREEMEARAQRTSVPQIFIGDHHVGGCDDMYELEDKGELDALLGLSNKESEQDSAA